MKTRETTPDCREKEQISHFYMRKNVVDRDPVHESSDTHGGLESRKRNISNCNYQEFSEFTVCISYLSLQNK